MLGNIISSEINFRGKPESLLYLTNPEPFQSYPRASFSSEVGGRGGLVMYFGIRQDELGDRFIFLQLNDDNSISAYSRLVNEGLLLDNAFGVPTLILNTRKFLEGRELTFARERIKYHSNL
ncbi:MAG: hypothetical protein WCK29_01980 [archaeon]